MVGGDWGGRGGIVFVLANSSLLLVMQSHGWTDLTDWLGLVHMNGIQKFGKIKLGPSTQKSFRDLGEGR